MKKLAVFGSGNGSNFEAIVKYFSDKPVKISCISDKSDSYILKRAQYLNIENYFISLSDTEKFLKENYFDLIALAGYMRILPAEVLKNRTIINIHPSLLPEFKGMNAIKRAHETKAPSTGITVHYVVEELDSGPIIYQQSIDIDENMTLQELEAKIHKLEHKIYPKIIDNLLFDQ